MRGAVVAVAVLLAGAPAAAAPKWTMAPAFAVNVSLSQKAAARLARPRETIIVSAEYFGDANDLAVKHHLEDDGGWIDFRPPAKAELPAAGLAHFAPHRYDATKLRYVDGGKIQVLINVYSGRRSSPDNLLDCGIFQDTVELAAKTPIPIACKLIGEE